MLGSIYYDDPPPQQRRLFVPIPAQGNQPPRLNLRLRLPDLLNGWPTGFEYQPYQRAVFVPIPTAATVNNPPRMSWSNLNVIVRSWDLPPNPVQDYIGSGTATVATSGAAAVNNPPRMSFVNMRVITQSWDVTATPIQDYLPNGSPIVESGGGGGGGSSPVEAYLRYVLMAQ